MYIRIFLALCSIFAVGTTISKLVILCKHVAAERKKEE